MNPLLKKMGMTLMPWAWLIMLINLAWPLPFSELILLAFLVTVTGHLCLALACGFGQQRGLNASLRVLVFGLFAFWEDNDSSTK
ncbi:hypothetical protein [Ferrimonas aestuarii]|uniref:DUF1145 domain-containing protein n=1 Tax=Ferrimonas aestuarii TaxID=2569539 RepID=A0A4U1BSM4_9GAMM|nr:hypothetical protein [Ferrimonas aestuarii]TKB55051.1 hypothetical protein FCL42_10845 [Ferrimonas aestuarii]